MYNDKTNHCLLVFYDPINYPIKKEKKKYQSFLLFNVKASLF